jgi:hypothetical protein
MLICAVHLHFLSLLCMCLTQSGDFSRPGIRKVLVQILGHSYSSLALTKPDRNAYYDLLVWALLRNQPDFAQYFWRQLLEFAMFYPRFLSSNSLYLRL